MRDLLTVFGNLEGEMSNLSDLVELNAKRAEESARATRDPRHG